MNRRELSGDLEEALRMSIDYRQALIWTCMPAIVVDFDADRQTCSCRVAIKMSFLGKDGLYTEVEVPLLRDCPVKFSSGGGVTLTFPIKPDDEVLVVFANRCIDSWWSEGGVQSQAEFRMHDLSDGFVLPGIKSQVNKFPVNTSAARLTMNDGSAYVEMNASTGDVIVKSTNIKLDGKVTVTGDLIVQGKADVTGTVKSGSVSLSTHTHPGVTPGGGSTGTPI